MEKKNRNRGYKQLRVWEDAITLYVDTCRLFKPQAFEMKRVAGQAIASADSVHRNIAEGYCRRSIREYIQHLYKHFDRKRPGTSTNSTTPSPQCSTTPSSILQILLHAISGAAQCSVISQAVGTIPKLMVLVGTPLLRNQIARSPVIVFSQTRSA